MKRILAVLLIAALTTLMLGVHETSWASQDPTARRSAQRAEVLRRLKDMHRGSTVEIELTDGTKLDAVIQDITADAVTVMVEDGAGVTTRSVQIADMTALKAVSARKMSTTRKVLIVTAIAAGVLVVAVLAACASASAYPEQPAP